MDVVVLRVGPARLGEGEGDGGAGLLDLKVDGVEGERGVDCAGVKAADKRGLV